MTATTSAISDNDHVLLTGGSGFIASHILDKLAEQGIRVTATVRSSNKGRLLKESLPDKYQPLFNYVIVSDVVADNAFDQAVKSAPFTYVIHTAMPYHTHCTDPVKDFIDPAVKGTTGILKSIHALCPTVKRVVLTSSSATILNIKSHAKMYNEQSYSPLTLEDAFANPHYGYSTAKVYAERAAWDFMAFAAPSFTLATINNTYTFGPIQRFLTTAAAINASNHRILAMVRGAMAHALPPTERIITFVDVRDVATAHVRAMLVPAAAGQRFFVVADYFTNKAIAESIRAHIPELDAVLPPRDAYDALPDWAYGFDNSRSREVLGLEYMTLEKSVADTAASMMRFRFTED